MSDKLSIDGVEWCARGTLLPLHKIACLLLLVNPPFSRKPITRQVNQPQIMPHCIGNKVEGYLQQYP